MPDSLSPRLSAIPALHRGRRLFPGESRPFRKRLIAALIAGAAVLAPLLPSAHAADRSAPSGHSEPKVRSIPEYDRAMKRVVLCLDAGRSSLALHRELLAKFPPYTEILLLLPRERVEAVTREMAALPRRDRIRLIPFEGEPADHGVLHFINQAGKRLKPEAVTSAMPLQFGTIWAQDLIEPVALPGGGLRLVTAPVHLCLWTEAPNARSRPVTDNRYLSVLSPRGMEVKQIPVAFKGGNILIARKGSRTFAFCGSDIRAETGEVRQSFPALVTADSLLARTISGALGTDTAAVIGGNRLQPRRMYHLDQAMLPLSDGVVAVTRITGDAPDDSRAKAALGEAETFLTELREALKSLGFTVMDMDTPARSVLRSNFFVNAIPYTDAVTRRRTILLPDFGDPGEAEAVRANTERLSALGYTVVTVPCRTGNLKGGIHCLINVLE